jgi:hypothetical protein
MKTFWIAAGVGTLAALGLAAAAVAQTAPVQKGPAVPKSWNYKLDSKGNPIRKGNRVVKPDGSWREEIPQGKCTTIKEMSAKGEYRESHDCGPSA